MAAEPPHPPAPLTTELKTELGSPRLARILFGQAGTSAGRGVADTFTDPLMRQVLGAPADLVGLTLGLAKAAGVLVPPVVGAWSDAARTRWGRRTPFIVGFSLVAALGLAAMPLAPTLGAVMVATVLVYVGAVGSQTPYQVLVPDLLPPERLERGYAVSSLVAAVGAGVGFGLGGALFDSGPALPFLAAAGFVLASLAWSLSGFREGSSLASPLPATRRRGSELEGAPRGALRLLLENRAFLAFLLAQTVWWVGLGAFPPFAITYVRTVLGLSTGLATLVFGLVGALTLGAVLGLGRLELEPRRRPLALGLGLTVAGSGLLLAYAAGSALLPALAGLGLFALASSTFQVLPYAMAVSLAPPGRVGAYSGVSAMSKAIGGALAPPAAGLAIRLGGDDYRAVLLLAGLAVLASLPLLWAAGRLSRADHEPPL